MLDCSDPPVMSHLYIDGTTAAGRAAVLKLLAAVEAVKNSVYADVGTAVRTDDG
jgi:hypothetical protein